MFRKGFKEEVAFGWALNVEKNFKGGESTPGRDSIRGSGIKHKVGLGTEVKTTGPGKRLRKQWELSLGGCPRAAGKECGMRAKENGLSFSRNKNHHMLFFLFLNKMTT